MNGEPAIATRYNWD